MVRRLLWLAWQCLQTCLDKYAGPSLLGELAHSQTLPTPLPSLAQAAVGALPVDALLYDSKLKYLLVVLRDEGPATREAFLNLKPNNAQLGAAHTGGQLVGVIVSMAGARTQGKGSRAGGVGATDVDACYPGWSVPCPCSCVAPSAAIPQSTSTYPTPGDGSRHDFLSRFFAPWAGIEVSGWLLCCGV